MTRTLKLVVCTLFSIAPLVYLAFIWQDLPAIVPTHFDAAGEANGFSPKSMLWVVNGFMAAMTVGVYLLLNNLHHIDPKRRGAGPSESFSRLADGLVLFFTVINFIALLASSGHQVAMARMIFPLIGLLFLFLGNVMYSLKPNYFAGLRLPWTLADDANWRATHRVAGVTWFVGGLLLVLCSVIVQQQYIPIVLFGIMAPMILVPVAYSFWYFKRAAANNR